MAAPQVQAATFTVTNLSDAGAGSLRAAIDSANLAAGADVITFQAGLTGTITLTTGQLSITDSVDIQGPGAASLTVSGNDSSRVFYLYSPSSPAFSATIADLTVANGNAQIGAGIVVFDENLTLDGVVVTGNDATNVGGGIFFDGFNAGLTLRDTTVSGNTAVNGGGIYIEDTGVAGVLIEDTVITGNQASDNGGGVYLYDPDAPVTFNRTTISNNTATNAGGGIFLYDTDGGPFSITNSTISGNSAAAGAGAFIYGADHPVIVRNTTISGNQAGFVAGGIYFYYSWPGSTIELTTVASNSSGLFGGGIAAAKGELAITNSIVANNAALYEPDLVSNGATFNVAYSLIEVPPTEGGEEPPPQPEGAQAPPSELLNDNGGNLFGVDPNLGPLGNNGGPTLTHLPLIGSPVIDAANLALTPGVTTDQRGGPRPIGAAADMGAVEINGGTLIFNPNTATVAENAGSVTLTVTRSGGTDPTQATYTPAGGTATAGVDFTATPGTVTFAAGQLSQTINIPILDDPAYESSETFTVGLSAPAPGAAIGASPNNAATVTITDTEPGILQFELASYDVTENGGVATLRVTRTGGSTGAVSATYATSNGSAVAGSDYTATTNSVSFVNGDTAPKTITVPIIDDTVPESAENFTVTLSAPTGGATLGAQTSANVNIADFEAGTIQLSSATYSVGENGGTLTVTVNRINGSTGAVAVNYATSNGTATAGADYTANAGTINFAAGDTTAKTFAIAIAPDALTEGDETFNITLSTPTNGAVLGAPSSAVATILDAPSGTIAFTSATATTAENSGTVTLNLTRSGGTSGSLAVNYTTANGTATAGSDYTATSGTVTFGPGEATKQIVVPILDDSTPEPSETFTVTLSGPAAGAPATSTVTIMDTEAGTLQFSNPVYSVNESGGTVTLTVNRINGSEGTVTVNYATANGSATAGSDYTASSGTLTFGPGDVTPRTIVIPITPDLRVEGPETFTVNLTAPTGGATLGATSSAVTTIVDGPEEIPTLGFFGRMFAMIGTAMVGILMITKKRLFGFFFALLFLGLTGSSLSAAMPAQRTPAQKKHAGKAEAKAANKVRGTVAALETNAKGFLVVTLQGGATFTLAKADSNVRDIRGRAVGIDVESSAIQIGQEVVIKTKLRRNGQTTTTVKILH